LNVRYGYKMWETSVLVIHRTTETTHFEAENVEGEAEKTIFDS
jgi:hypothetical protein